MKKLALLGILLITAIVIGCTQPKEKACATNPDCECTIYTVEPGTVYYPAKFCGLDNGIKECELVGEECKPVYVTEEDLRGYCGNQLNQFSALYTCKDGYFKLVYNNIGGGIKLLKPGQQAVECPVVAPDAMSEECKKMLEEGYCSEENLCEENGGTGLANPASVHCEQEGGTLKMYNSPKGTLGICEFQDKIACEEWAYYRGECVPGDCQVKCEYIGQKTGWNLVCSGGGQVLEIANCTVEEPEPQEPPEEEFCGTSTNASCETNQDCERGGCSGQVCEGKDEDTITTCEFRNCYNAYAYNLTCQCKDNQCQWT